MHSRIRLALFIPTVLLLVTSILSGEQQQIAAVNCSYLKDPQQFTAAPVNTEAIATFISRSVAADVPVDIGRQNFIDEHVFGRLESAGIPSAPLTSDLEFLRRVTLDLTGRIPSADDVAGFPNDHSAGKRARLIDTLVASPELTDKWTMFLGDLFKLNSTSSNIILHQQGRDAMFAYLRDSVHRNKPYNQIATELITATGNNLYEGAANWLASGYVAGPVQDTHDNQAVMTATQFLGINVIDCLLCHDGARHLDALNLWGRDQKRKDIWGFSAFFARTFSERSVANMAGNFFKMTVMDLPWGEYQLDTNFGNRVARKSVNGFKSMIPVYPFTREVPEPGDSRRMALARYLTSDPQFSRAIVNYIWEKLMVVAFVSPSDAFDLARLDPANPPQAPWTLQPTNPELLNALSQWFSDNGYDLRALISLIAKSNTYQLSSVYPGTWKADYVPYYAKHYPRRLEAEEIHDAIVTATGIKPSYVLDYAYSLNPLPPVSWAMQFPDTREPRTNNAVLQFLNAFGRGDRDLVPRRPAGSVLMGLTLMNNAFVLQRIHANNNGSTVQRLLASSSNPQWIAEQLFVTTLSRNPTIQELEAALEIMKRLGNTRGAEALQWALLNKLDFIHSY